MTHGIIAHAHIHIIPRYEEIDDFWKNVAGGTFFGIIYLLVRLEYVERMHGTLDNEDQKTNSIFKNTILEELEKEKV